MSDSDDDFSLFAAAKASGGGAAKGSDSDSPEPAWFASHTSAQKAKGAIISLDTDSDDDQPIAKHTGGTRAAAPRASAKAKDSVIELSDSDEEGELPAKLPASAANKPAPGPAPVGAGKRPAEPSTSAKPPLPGPGKRAATGGANSSAEGAKKLAAGAKAGSQADSQGNTGASQQVEGSQATTGSGVKGEVIVMMPDKLPLNKVLAELEDRRDADGLGATDLSGDSGAVGRLLVSGSGDDSQVMVDLKGGMYNVTMAPLSGTVCVVSVGQTEAKVEAVLGSFMQLREESNINMGEAVMEGVFDFNDDDDDLQIGFGGGAEEKTKEGGKAKAGGKGKPKVGSKAKPRAKPKAKAAGTKGKGKGGAPKGASKAKQIGKKSTGVKKK